MATNYLLPNQPTGTLNDAALEDFFYDFFTAVCGYPDSMVRPEWQPDPPPIPSTVTDWMAFGIGSVEGDWDPFVEHSGGSQISDSASAVGRSEYLTIRLHFYGPNAQNFRQLLQMGIAISPNREKLQAKGFAPVEVTRAPTVTAKIKQKYYRQIDCEMLLRRYVQWTYPVPSVNSATGSIITDVPPTVTPIVVEPDS